MSATCGSCGRSPSPSPARPSAPSGCSALAAWNQYLWPQRVTTEESHRTIQIGLAALRGSQVDEPQPGHGRAIIAAVPIAIGLILFQRQLVRGLTAGAIKGWNVSPVNPQEIRP